MADVDPTNDPTPTQAALDGQTAPGQTPTPTQEPPGGATAAELTKQEQESRAQLDDLLTRYRDTEAERDKLKGELDEAVEADPITVNVRVGIESRLARLENEVRHLASKEDLANMKVWGLVTIGGALLTLALGIASIVAKFWP